MPRLIHTFTIRVVAALVLIVAALQIPVPPVAAQGISDSEARHLAELEQMKRQRVEALSPCEQAYYFFWYRNDNPEFANGRKITEAEFEWMAEVEAGRFSEKPCPPMPPEVVNGILAEAPQYASGTLASYTERTGRDRARAQQASQQRAQATAAQQADLARVEAIPPCERAYLFFFYRLNNPLYADKRRMTDDEIGWALDYERARRTGQPCPPMPPDVTNGILAEASIDAKGTLIGQNKIGALDQQRQALVDYDRRATEVLTAAENCWANGRAEAFRKSNPAEAMFYAWQRCAQVIANAEALTGQRKIVWPSISDFNAMSNFVANSLRNKWAEQDASLARAQRQGDRGPVWGSTRDAELERRNNILDALRNNERYLSYIDSFDYRGNAARNAPRQARSQYPQRPSSYPPFQRQ